MKARDPASPAAAACEQAMTVVGQLLRSEHADGYPLLHFFGGGYEIAYYDGTRFRKRGNLSYAVWDAKVWLGFGGRPACSFMILPLHSRTRPIRNVAPVAEVERGVTAQPVAA